MTMTECDRCGDESRVTTTLNHVHFDKSPISRMVSSYTVCNSCMGDIKDDPDITYQ